MTTTADDSDDQGDGENDGDAGARLTAKRYRGRRGPSVVCADVVDLSNDGVVNLPIQTSQGASLSTSTLPTAAPVSFDTTDTAATSSVSAYYHSTLGIVFT